MLSFVLNELPSNVISFPGNLVKLYVFKLYRWDIDVLVMISLIDSSTYRESSAIRFNIVYLVPKTLYATFVPNWFVKTETALEFQFKAIAISFNVSSVVGAPLINCAILLSVYNLEEDDTDNINVFYWLVNVHSVYFES